MVRVLITGAAGNLGSHLARHLMGRVSLDFRLRLMIHKKDLPFPLPESPFVESVKADLASPATLDPACEGVDCLVHFAGVLFAPNPEAFLPTTNTVYAGNLVDAALRARVRRFILISFPHVEGETAPGRLANGTLEGNPVSVHAQTRLKAEQYLFKAYQGAELEPVALRPGMIYGKNILMVDAAKFLAQSRLLAVWKKPTWIHLISIDDFLECVRVAIEKPGIWGVYNLGDEKAVTLQQFLDKASERWRCAKPVRLPEWCFYAVAWLCETFASIFRTRSPLTMDFIRIGMVSYASDTSRMKRELLETLKYPTLSEGIQIL
ncbi:MAG: NAD(P)H-binding protein [Armatimonadetes bacterium]|nr:NAD(P)H-binding protein [Armatimonadota bacterium]